MTQQGTQAPPGSKTFVHAQVTSILFNTPINKRAGGQYVGTVLNYMDQSGQVKAQNWAQQIIDDARNIELRNMLVALHSTPGAQITIHKTKNEKGFWNVDRIDQGYVEGVRTQPAAATAPADAGIGPAPLPAVGAPAAGQPAQQYAPAALPAASAVPAQTQAQPFDDRSNKMRSKEQCMREAAVQTAAALQTLGANGQISMERLFSDAEVVLNYITNGLAAPVQAAQPAAQPVAAAAPVATPVQQPVPVQQAAPAPIPVQQTAPVQQTPAPAPVVAPVVAAAAAAPVAAQPASFDDGFGG